MINGAYAGLRRAARAAPAMADDSEYENGPDTEDDEVAGAKPKKKDTDMNDTETTDAALAAAEAKGRAEGAAATHQRYAAVMASDHYAGREKLAMKLLGNDKLSADEIIDTLQAADTAAPAEAADPEAAARAEMQDAIAETGNSNADASGAGSVNKAEATSAVWDSAIAKVFPKSKAA